jgi:hypothetical protein
VSTATPPDGEDIDQVVERLDEPSARLGPEPPRQGGATASERAAAQAVHDLSEPERLDGAEGPA